MFCLLLFAFAEFPLFEPQAMYKAYVICLAVARVPTKSSRSIAAGRSGPFLEQKIFNSISSETELMRYLHTLQMMPAWAVG